jgi:hypothetical protein
LLAAILRVAPEKLESVLATLLLLPREKVTELAIVAVIPALPRDEVTPRLDWKSSGFWAAVLHTLRFLALVRGLYPSRTDSASYAKMIAPLRGRTKRTNERECVLFVLFRTGDYWAACYSPRYL